MTEDRSGRTAGEIGISSTATHPIDRIDFVTRKACRRQIYLTRIKLTNKQEVCHA
jgi:hypothetical protein